MNPTEIAQIAAVLLAADRIADQSFGVWASLNKIDDAEWDSMTHQEALDEAETLLLAAKGRTRMTA
jgi:hypothetical protein